MEHHGKKREAPTARTEEQRKKELQKIKVYRELEDELRERVARGAFNERRTFECTKDLLKANPEYYTVWNLRRRCMMAGVLTSTAEEEEEEEKGKEEAAAASRAQIDDSYLSEELEFTLKLLKKFPKCYWIWNYRKWILEQYILRVPKAAACGAWRNELAYTQKVLYQDHRNFHAWGYRRYLVAKLETPALLGQSLVEDEFIYTTRMIELELSNFSAWHYRSRLMFRVLEERKADDKVRAEFFQAERELIQDAINCGIEDQSLWYYYRFFMAQALGSEGRPTIIPNMPAEEKIRIIEEEIDWVEDMLMDGSYPNLIYPYEAMVEHTLALFKLQPSAKDVREQNNPKYWLVKIRENEKNKNTKRWDELERNIERQLATESNE